MIDWVIRSATPGDAPAVASLLRQLGYPATPEQAAPRLARAMDDPRRAVFVAEREGRVVGLCVAETRHVINRDEMSAVLATLVTDESVRGQGAGHALVRHFEDWARRQGAISASLTTALHREEAHGFYETCGWTRTGWRFGRDLSS
jgi:GNAT superfamily N-acetyltransferase